jgi:hypothetical protein
MFTHRTDSSTENPYVALVLPLAAPPTSMVDKLAEVAESAEAGMAPTFAVDAAAEDGEHNDEEDVEEDDVDDDDAEEEEEGAAAVD